MTLKLGYKASAEQFDPRELVEIAVAAEAHGMETRRGERPLPAVAARGRARAVLARPGWRRSASAPSTIQIGTSVMTPTFRYNPAVIAQAFATHGRAVPGSHHARRRHRRGAERDRHRIPWRGRAELARVQGALRPPARGRRADARAVDATTASTSRASTTRPHDASHLRPARDADPGLRRRGRAGGGALRGPRGRRLHLHLRQGHGRSTPTSSSRPSRRAPRRPGATSTTIDRMIEIKLSYDTDPDAALENTRFWAPLSLSARAEARHHRPDRDGEGRGCPPDRADRQALDRRLRPRRGRRRRSSSTWTPGSTTSSSTRPGTTSAASSSCSSATWRRGCGRWGSARSSYALAACRCSSADTGVRLRELSSPRPITRRWIWLVPSKICITLASRMKRSTGKSRV